MPPDVAVGSPGEGSTNENGVCVGGSVAVGRGVFVAVGCKVAVGVQVGGSWWSGVGVPVGKANAGGKVFGGKGFIPFWGLIKIAKKTTTTARTAISTNPVRIFHKIADRSVRYRARGLSS